MNSEPYRDRQALVQGLAADRGLDGILVYSWRRAAVVWLTGYFPGFATNWAAAWVPRTGTAQLLVRFPFELERAKKSGLSVRSGDDVTSIVPAGVRRLGVVGGDLAIDELPVAIVSRLAQRDIYVEDLTSDIDELRELKSDEDVEQLRQAAEIAAAGLASGHSPRGGETGLTLASRVEATCREHGALRATCLVGAGEGVVITEANQQQIARSDVVGLELTLWTATACCHVNQTLLPESPKPHQLTALQACAAARQAMLGAMSPGVEVKSAVAIGEAILESYGLLDAIEYDFGHGLGCDTPEHPRMVRSSDRRFRNNSVIALHVGVRHQQLGTAFVGGPVLVQDRGSIELLEGAPWSS